MANLFTLIFTSPKHGLHRYTLSCDNSQFSIVSMIASIYSSNNVDISTLQLIFLNGMYTPSACFAFPLSWLHPCFLWGALCSSLQICQHGTSKKQLSTSASSHSLIISYTLLYHVGDCGTTHLFTNENKQHDCTHYENCCQLSLCSWSAVHSLIACMMQERLYSSSLKRTRNVTVQM